MTSAFRGFVPNEGAEMSALKAASGNCAERGRKMVGTNLYSWWFVPNGAVEGRLGGG